MSKPDKRVVEAIHHVAKEHNTPDEIVRCVVAKLLPAIRLVPQSATKKALPIGGCRIGGCPDLPKGMKWPRRSDAANEDPGEWDPNSPLQFVLQVNLEEIVTFDVNKVLPKKGLLSFFFAWAEEEPDVAHIVLSETTDLQRLRYPRDLEEKCRYQPLELKPCVEWTVASIEDSGLPHSILNPDEPVYMQNFQHYEFFEEIEELVAEVQGLEPATSAATVHRLLGHPRLIQTPGLAEGTRLLLQADSDPPSTLAGDFPRTGMMWGDSGRLYYLISEEELKSKQLAKEPWVTVEMC